MLFIEQRGDDGIETYRLTLSCCTSHQKVRRLCQVEHKDLVGDGLTQRTRQFHGCFLELLGIENRLHRHDIGFGIRNLNTDGALAGNRCDDTNAEC